MNMLSKIRNYIVRSFYWTCGNCGYIYPSSSDKPSNCPKCGGWPIRK